MTKLIRSLRSFCGEESGATMVEYGLMVALIAAACIAAVTALGGAVGGQFTGVAGSI